MAQPKKYHGDRPATPAERQAAYNERKRQEERDRLAAVEVERKRIAQMKLDTRISLGKAIRKDLRIIATEREWETEQAIYVQQIIQALEKGSNYIP